MKLVSLLFFITATGYAQVASASLSGTVLDQSSGAIAAAAVIAMQPTTAFTRSTVTDAHGNYVFDSLPIGAYTITARRSGFRDYEASGIILEVNQKARHDIRLTLGAAQDRITVTASVSPVDTEGASIGY